jgi:hypothetical protein
MSKTWALTFKLIRKIHNQKVFIFYKENLALRNALLIGAKESGIEILNKQFLFSLLAKENQSVIAIPESWNILPTSSTPQLILIYRSENNKRSGNYQITFPHFDGPKNFLPIEYQKGPYSVTYTLSDNSKILVNASSFNEGERVIKKFLPYINLKFRNGTFKYTKRTGIKIQQMKAYRADFFGQGRLKANYPDWSIFFK